MELSGQEVLSRDTRGQGDQASVTMEGKFILNTNLFHRIKI